MKSTKLRENIRMRSEEKKKLDNQDTQEMKGGNAADNISNDANIPETGKTRRPKSGKSL